MVLLDQILLDDRTWPGEAIDEERVALFCELIRDHAPHAAPQARHPAPARPEATLATYLDRTGHEHAAHATEQR